MRPVLSLSKGRLTAGFFACLLAVSPAFAEEGFRCEVLSVRGTVTSTDLEGKARQLAAGDLLEVGDQVAVADDSHADLAYDKDWQNVTRLEANSKVKISSIVPGKLELKEGGVFAKLKKLPQGSSFEVKTPTAVATVRGSEYRTTFLFGQTDVFNADSSRVVVYGVTADGAIDKDTAVMVEKDKKTSVGKVGEPPVAPVAMTEEEKGPVEVLGTGIDSSVEKAEKEGRTSKIQSISEMEEFIRTEKKKAINVARKDPQELSRVTDSRRRAFGGDSSMAPPDPEPPAEAEAEPVPAENA